MNALKLLFPVVLIAAIYWNYPRTTDLPADMVMPDIFDPAKKAAEREQAIEERWARAISEKKRHRAEDMQYNAEIKAAEKDPRRKPGDNSYCKDCDLFAKLAQESPISSMIDHVRRSEMRVHCPECGRLALLFWEKKH